MSTMDPEKAAEEMRTEIMRHRLMSSKVDRSVSIAFLEDLMTLLEMELQGLKEEEGRDEEE